jgi:hypothetical protein
MARVRSSFPGNLLAVTLTFGMIAGCQGNDPNIPKLAPVTGVVTYRGSPLAGATVSLISTDPARGHLPGIGSTDDDGLYRIRSYNLDGAPLGNHKVTIVAIDEDSLVKDPNSGYPLPRMHPKWKPPVWRIPERYGHPDKSRLTAEVVENKPNRFDFELEEK